MELDHAECDTVDLKGSGKSFKLSVDVVNEDTIARLFRFKPGSVFLKDTVTYRLVVAGSSGKVPVRPWGDYEVTGDLEMASRRSLEYSPALPSSFGSYMTQGPKDDSFTCSPFELRRPSAARTSSATIGRRLSFTSRAEREWSRDRDGQLQCPMARSTSALRRKIHVVKLTGEVKGGRRIYSQKGSFDVKLKVVDIANLSKLVNEVAKKQGINELMVVTDAQGFRLSASDTSSVDLAAPNQAHTQDF